MPCKNIIDDLKLLESKNNQLKEIINEYQFEHITVSYEKLTNNFTSEASKILTFLGVDNSIGLTTQSQKITSDRLEDAIENYSELISALRNSKYELLLH